MLSHQKLGLALPWQSRAPCSLGRCRHTFQVSMWARRPPRQSYHSSSYWPFGERTTDVSDEIRAEHGEATLIKCISSYYTSFTTHIRWLFLSRSKYNIYHQPQVRDVLQWQRYALFRRSDSEQSHISELDPEFAELELIVVVEKNARYQSETAWTRECGAAFQFDCSLHKPQRSYCFDRSPGRAALARCRKMT